MPGALSMLGVGPWAWFRFGNRSLKSPGMHPAGMSASNRSRSKNAPRNAAASPEMPSRPEARSPEGVELKRVGLAVAVAETKAFLTAK